jgi:hypothetical protein
MLSAKVGENPFYSPPDRIMRALNVDHVAALVSAGSWSRLLRLSALFPAKVQTVCFECLVRK